MGQDADNQMLRIGELIREHRENVGWTQTQLGRRALCSESMISHLERGKRHGDRPTLRRIFGALGVFPLAQEYILHLSEQPGDIQARLLAAETVDADEQDLAMLSSLQHPGCLLQPGSFDILASNEAFRNVFAGATETGNLLYYQLLDPRSKYVVVDWEAQTQLFVGAFHCIGPAVVSRERWSQMNEDLGVAPEFAPMMSRRFTAEDLLSFTTTVTTRDPRTDRTQLWYRNVSTMVFPYDRSTWYMTCHPIGRE